MGSGITDLLIDLVKIFVLCMGNILEEKVCLDVSLLPYF